ncbi:germination protein YpeB [Paenibacillus lautus]|jgi:spore germination protein|uniref:Germination protein YpeB n=1 Tax=Paenibacillus lautus TaxID=1401 RepID=A0A385TP17_PAELA|nr:germination protein YpeB [Paenibacillus lautus]AYB45201.1 germination protein YpeB [Paenibacillus lautus]MBY0160424.1 germination protein YpeB [Cytobacillus firmus]MCI1774834.1 germination protein YpeB [Paenibacillus lautus]VTR63097.1 PSPA12 [Actinobacillus pleuropneumoniae]
MYKRLSAILFPVATILLIGALVWGYQENKEKNAILINAENQYQRAFHDLSYNMDRIHAELGNTLAVSSTSQGMHRKGLMNVWRLTSEAQNEISQLPLTLLPFNKTEEFLSRISNFAYKTGVRDLTKEPLSENEVKTLKSLYANSGEITKDLQHVQNKVIANSLRWMDVETALATNKVEDNSIIDGFKTVDKKVEAYPELDWGPSVSSIYDRRSVKQLAGMPVSEEDVKRKALKFSDAGNQANVQVTKNGSGTEWVSYTAKVKHPKGHMLSMDFTEKGGQLISYTDERNVGAKRASVQDAIDKAQQFLTKKGYSDMTVVSADQYDNLANFSFVREEDGVLIYPEKITVRSAMDNGEVIGFQASDFVYEHQVKRDIPQPKLSLAEAEKVLNPEFKVLYHRKALIKNDRSEDVLCYEFGGRINGSQYRIYINADTGLEETVEVVKDAQAGIK